MNQNKIAIATSAVRIPELDGLRGIAILSVVAIHYIGVQGKTSVPMLNFLLKTVSLGWSGVDLFFVLSGFLIGGILLDARGSANYFTTFYARRFFRIIPIYYAWILLWVILVTLAGQTLQAHSNSGRVEMTGSQVYIHFLFLQNMWPVSYFGLGAAWLSATWSLAVEEQFYLICPWVIRLLSRRNLYVTLIAVIVGTPFLRLLLRTIAHVNPGWIYGFMPSRMDALAFGVLTALLWRNDQFKEWIARHVKAFSVARIILGLGALCLLIWRPGMIGFLEQTIGYTWLAIFYSVCMVSVILRPTDWLAKCLRISWLRSVGVVSYCIYIIHQAVDVVLHAMLLKSPPRSDTQWGAVVTVMAAILTYLIAQLSWNFFERPLLKRGHQFKYDVPEAAVAAKAPITKEVVSA